MRRRFPQGSSELTFPSQQLLSEERDSEEERAAEPEEKQSKQSTEVLSKKVLPDRTLAARNRANERLVNFIVKKRGVENRLKVRFGSSWFSHVTVQKYETSHVLRLKKVCQ